MPRRPRPHLRIAAAACAAFALLGGATPAYANAPAPRFNRVEQVSDQSTRGAAVTDPLAINTWGLALSPTSPLWVANAGSNTSTLYSGGVNGAPANKVGLTVTIPGAPPTGQVFNDTTDFAVTGPGGSGPGRFIFDSVAGEITAWNPTASPTQAITVAHVTGASYTGLALLHTDLGAFLLAADFQNGRIDVFDGAFHRVPLPSFFFSDPRLPAGYAPFNVQVIGDRTYVAYAKRDPATGRSVAGAGLGFVDVYTNFGTTLHRVASRAVLNAPWGLAIAPASFGSLAGDLLVGNFGDGRISAYRGNDFEGQLRAPSGMPIAIDKLWALLPGTANTGGTGTVWYSSGPDSEQHGLIGELIPATG
jgi:uncharacterized protein (TIGR03118 family)